MGDLQIRDRLGLSKKKSPMAKGPFVCCMMERPQAIQDSNPPLPVPIFSRFIHGEVITSRPRSACYGLAYPGDVVSTIEAFTDIIRAYQCVVRERLDL